MSDYDLEVDSLEYQLINIQRNRDTGELIVCFDDCDSEGFVRIPAEGLKTVGLEASDELQKQVAESARKIAGLECVNSRLLGLLRDWISVTAADNPPEPQLDKSRIGGDGDATTNS